MTDVLLAPGDPAADLSPARRNRDLAECDQPTDVIVIGGGITGVGVALDAASRGLRVTLLERFDLAFGTSRWSSKLVHGGLRYLAQGDVSVAWESAVERGRLMRVIAPFLIRPLPQVIPIMDDDHGMRAVATRIGLAAGDALRIGSGTFRTTLPGARTLSRTKVAQLLPAIDTAHLRGGLLSWDGSLEDDARLTIAVARTAAAFGARILTGMQVLRAEGDRVIGCHVDTGESFEIRARHVVNATGVWSDTLAPGIPLTASRGTHVVLRRSRVGNPKAALTVPVPEMRGRYCFVLPRPDGLAIAGITDIHEPKPIPLVPDSPTDDIDWILQHVSRVLDTPLSLADAVGAFTGLRPLVGADGIPTSDISRQHLVSQGSDGVWTVTGGKLTTYRRMAQDVVDNLTVEPCRTTHISLIGTGPLRSAHGLPARLIRRYGAEAPRVAAYADDAPHLLQPIAPGIPVLGVEFVYGSLVEGARHPDDLLERRTRIDLVTEDMERARPFAEAQLADAP